MERGQADISGRGKSPNVTFYTRKRKKKNGDMSKITSKFSFVVSGLSSRSGERGDNGNRDGPTDRERQPRGASHACHLSSQTPGNNMAVPLFSPMSSQTSNGEAAPPSRPHQRTFLDDVILTFSSPMAWLLVVALIITWSAVAIVLFDLLDYKTLTGLPPPPAIAKRGLRARGAVRPIKSSPAGVPSEVKAQESIDWMGILWTFAASLVAPDDEEEGIHQLTETFTSLHSEEL